jgi:hypothetical protein
MRTHEVHATSPHGARFRKWAVLTAALAVPLLTVAWSTPASAFFPGGPTVDIVVTSTANPSTYDQSVTYTATLTTSDLGPLNMGDAIQFQDDGGDVPGCNSSGLAGTPTPGVFTATCQTSSATMTVGVHNITALFGGDATYNPGSGFLTQTVNQAATTTVITSPLPDASVSYGNESENSFNVTVSAPGVSDYSPSGSVNLYDGVPGPDTYLCTTGLGGGGGQSNGNCWIDSNQLNAGSYSLTAVYGGDSNFTGSSSSPQNFTVDQVTSQMQAFPIPGYAFYGAEKGNFFIAGVGGNGNGNPTGYVSIQADGVNLVPPDSCPAGNGGNPCYIDSATVLPASTTPYEVTLSYPGDANFTPVSTTVPLTVFPATTTTSLSVSPATAAFGSESSVRISATVTSGTTGSPTGSVAVQDGGNTVCTISNLSPSGPNTATGSCAALSDTDLSSGTYSLTANYPGDGNYQSSISSAHSLTIAGGANQGYWLVGSDGGIFSFGSAQFYGSTGSLRLQRPVVGITPTSDQGGYWTVASDGGVFAFGDAGFHGSLPGLGLAPAGAPGPGPKLNAPIVGMVPSTDGGGYFMVASDGGVFAFGDAHFEGSCPGIGGCAGSAVAVLPDASGNGYWLVTNTGNVYAFGDAPQYGAPGNQGSSVTSAVRTPGGGGYWILLADGAVYGYGDAGYLGGASGLGGLNPATAVFATADGGGYWLAAANGTVLPYGNATDLGDMAAAHLNAPIIAATGW